MWCVYYKGNIEFEGMYDECEMYLETVEMDRYHDLLDEGWSESDASWKSRQDYSMKRCD